MKTKPLMDKATKVTFISLLLLTSQQTISSSSEKTHYGKHKIDGYVSHGVNVFNNKHVIDFTGSHMFEHGFHTQPPITEIGYFRPGEVESGVITESTDKKSLIATSSVMSHFFQVNHLVDPALINVPVDLIGSNFLGYSSPNDRKTPVIFSESKVNDIYMAESVLNDPTVEQWNNISGEIKANCKEDGSNTVKISIKNALPNQLYSLWDVAVLNPQTENESVYGVPFGGLPNVIHTDDKGCAERKMKVNFCPVRSCEPGSESCTAYVTLLYHWDDQIYGAAPSNTFAGLPSGVLGSNQMIWPMSGTPVQSPSTDFDDDDTCGE